MSVDAAVAAIASLAASDRDEANALVLELYKIEGALEDKLAELGLDHNIDVTFGGRSLMLEEDSWTGYERGDWVGSSAFC